MQPAVFIDRDGVINRNPPNYVKSWEEFLFLEGVLPALSRLSTLPWPIVVITNQSVVGRGIIPSGTLEDIHSSMVAEIRQAGGRIDGVYVCPHHPGEGCSCRKPQPGLLLQAASELNLALKQSVFLGDSRSDILAAIHAGVQPVFYRREGEGFYHSGFENNPGDVEIPLVKDFMEFVEMLDLVSADKKCPADMIYYLAARIMFSAI